MHKPRGAIGSTRRVLLLEPSYPNKYPPLGLMKLATYHKQRGDHVTFLKGREREALPRGPWDRVYVTTLFSFEWKRTAQAIDLAIRAANGQSERVIVGGIAASLMHEQFISVPRWAGVRFVQGLLDGPPAVSLQLSAADGEFGADDLTSTPIENLTPDYGILDHVGYIYPVNDAYFGYASRGCVRKCAFCGVPKLEGMQREMPSLAKLVLGVTKAHGPKKDLVLMDNNVAASSRYSEIMAEIRDLGFQRGATLARDGRRSVKRRVDFNQGVDARILVKSPMYLREMSTICISPLRIAFDHIGMRRVYEKAVRMAADVGIISLSNYMLYNFMDTPRDLYERMRLNIALNEELGIRIWSFPMRYHPVTLKDRSHIGPHWNRYQLRSFQIMLQATRGIVSGNSSFFDHAYGSTSAEFEQLLTLPHAFIFHRAHYEKRGPGHGVLKDYEAERGALSPGQEKELLSVLAGPAGAPISPRAYYRQEAADCSDPLLRKVLRYHILDTHHRLNEEQVLSAFSRICPGMTAPPEDELVEDAGLFDHETIMGQSVV